MIKATFLLFTNIPSPVSHTQPQLSNRAYVRFNVTERIVCYILHILHNAYKIYPCIAKQRPKEKKSLAPVGSARSQMTVLPQEVYVTTHAMMVKVRSEDSPLAAKQGLHVRNDISHGEKGLCCQRIFQSRILVKESAREHGRHRPSVVWPQHHVSQMRVCGSQGTSDGSTIEKLPSTRWCLFSVAI